MSLLCRETEAYIWEREKAYMVIHPMRDGYAVGEPVVEKIPLKARRDKPCGPFEDGLDVHEGVGTKSAGTWQWSTFSHGKFLFSISAETAKRYLPRTMRHIAKDVRRNAN